MSTHSFPSNQRLQLLEKTIKNKCHSLEPLGSSWILTKQMFLDIPFGYNETFQQKKKKKKADHPLTKRACLISLWCKSPPIHLVQVSSYPSILPGPRLGPSEVGGSSVPGRDLPSNEAPWISPSEAIKAQESGLVIQGLGIFGSGMQNKVAIWQTSLPNHAQFRLISESS